MSTSASGRRLRAQRSRAAYILVLLVFLQAVLAVCLAVSFHLMAVSAQQSQLAESCAHARWAADAAVEEAQWRLARQAAGGPAPESPFTSRSNECLAEVRIAEAGPNRYRIEALAQYVPEESPAAAAPVKARVTAVVEVDPAARQVRTIAWSEGWPEAEK